MVGTVEACSGDMVVEEWWYGGGGDIEVVVMTLGIMVMIKI